MRLVEKYIKGEFHWWQIIVFFIIAMLFNLLCTILLVINANSNNTTLKDVDDKQDVFLEDRIYYQTEIGNIQNTIAPIPDMQEQLNRVEQNTKRIADQLDIDYITITVE